MVDDDCPNGRRDVRQTTLHDYVRALRRRYEAQRFNEAIVRYAFVFAAGMLLEMILR